MREHKCFEQSKSLSSLGDGLPRVGQGSLMKAAPQVDGDAAPLSKSSGIPKFQLEDSIFRTTWGSLGRTRAFELEQARDAAVLDADQLRAEKSVAETQNEAAVAEAAQLRVDLAAAQEDAAQLHRNLVQEQEARAAARASEVDTLLAMEPKIRQAAREACAAKEASLAEVRGELRQVQKQFQLAVKASKDRDALLKQVQSALRQATERERDLIAHRLGLEQRVAELSKEATSYNFLTAAEKRPKTSEKKAFSKIRNFVTCLGNVLQQRPLLFEALREMSDKMEREGVDLEGSKQITDQLESILHEHEEMIRKVKKGADAQMKLAEDRLTKKLRDAQSDCQVFSDAAFSERERADSAMRELESLRTLNDSLQQRLKSHSTDWNDTYGEVMRG